MSTTSVTRQASWTGRDLPALVDFATRSHTRASFLLVLFSLIAFLPGFFQIPPTDRDEARFAQASKQMVESRNLVDIRFQNEVRYKKPVGIYWMQSGVVATARALGVPDATTTIWLYRIPSLIGAVGAVLLTYWAALAFGSRRAAVLAALMMAGCVVLGVEARLAKTDAMLLLTAVAAMGAMARAYLRVPSPAVGAEQGWTLAAIFWSALAAGFLLKGPMILMFVGLAVVTLWIADRSIAWFTVLRPKGGVVWFLLLVLPWFVAIFLHSGLSFFTNSVGQDMMSKVASGQEAHGAPPGYYFALFWLTFWPGATLAGIVAPVAWRSRRERDTRFLLAWIVPAWILLELVMTKLPHYVMPLYPAIAILIAGAVDRAAIVRRPTLELGLMWWFVVPLLLAGAGLAALVMYGGQLGILAWPFAAGAVVFGLLAWRLYDHDEVERSLLRALVASVLVAFTVYAVVLPSLAILFPSKAMANVLKRAGCRDPQAASAGYYEPSLIFLAGTGTVLTDGAGAAEFLRPGGCRFAFVERREQRRFVQYAEAMRLRYSSAPNISAVNYSNGRLITIFVYRAESQQ